ncbi:MAG: hypothetical protein IH991_11165 [Planctomycetes bacterium]|nr:hypothetical protein [Planctomycetota bacterium]
MNTSNQQCQICHVATFDSLSHGHPEFSDYPYQRRTRLYFDHLSHFGRHFEERTASETTPQSCNDCHVQDVTGSYMLVRGFEQTCASCHSEQIEDDLDLGFAFATIPGLDVETLRNKGIDVGHWPDLYPLHVEAAGELGPLINLLLSSNESLAETMQHLDGVDLCNLSEATVAELEEVEKLVWAYKETLYDVLRGGQPAVQQRLNSVLAPQVSETEIAEWVKLIPIALLAKMQERWLPMLIKEVEAHREGRQLPMQDEASNVDAAKVLDEERRIAGADTSGWYLRESDMSLRYRPTGHADMLLKSLLEISARFAVDPNSRSVADQNQAFGSASAMRRVFASLSSPVATGRCLKCHTTDAVTTRGARVQWFANRPSLTERHFTEFKHSPHITLLDDKACYTCHQFKTDEKPKRSPFRAEYIHSNWSPSTDPHRFASNFVAMTKSRCANCHNQSGAGDSCRSCHNYHVR